MARVRIKLPKEFIYKTEIPVRVTDLNYGEHVGNDTVLSIVHEARMQFLQHYNFDEGKLVEPGIGLIMSDAALQYKAEIMYGAILEVFVTPNEYTSMGFELIYLIQDKKSKLEYARVKTGMVCFDYDTRKSLPLPQKIKEIWAVKNDI